MLLARTTRPILSGEHRDLLLKAPGRMPAASLRSRSRIGKTHSTGLPAGWRQSLCVERFFRFLESGAVPAGGEARGEIRRAAGDPSPDLGQRQPEGGFDLRTGEEQRSIVAGLIDPDVFPAGGLGGADAGDFLRNHPADAHFLIEFADGSRGVILTGIVALPVMALAALTLPPGMRPGDVFTALAFVTSLMVGAAIIVSDMVRDEPSVKSDE